MSNQQTQTTLTPVHTDQELRDAIVNLAVQQSKTVAHGQAVYAKAQQLQQAVDSLAEQIKGLQKVQDDANAVAEGAAAADVAPANRDSVMTPLPTLS